MALRLFQPLLLLLLASGSHASPSPSPPCAHDSDCHPTQGPLFPSGANVPSYLVQCVSGSCACNGPCFVLSSDNRCELPPHGCVRYDLETFQCQDGRKSQAHAFFLAIIFGMFGAANFYIGRLDCAIPQLVLFVIGAWGGGIYQYTAGRNRKSEEAFLGSPSKPSLLFRLTTGLIPMIVVFWWVADMIIFGVGSRNGKDGCSLIQDL